MQKTHFASHNPATQEIVWEGEATSAEEIQQAIRYARQAFESWGFSPLETRIQYLEAYKEKIKSYKETLTEAISKETGKPLWESRTEVASMIGKVPISIEAYKQRCNVTVRDQNHARSITRHKPHGVVAILGPYNFPGHLPNGHIIPALLAGNTVVFKPSEYTPLVGELLLKCWQEVDLPKGVFNLIQGGVESGSALVHSNEIDGLYFTGSWPTGKHFAEIFAEKPHKILALEMGGNNPLVISQAVDLKAAALATILSAFLTSGQRCSCARRLIVPRNGNGDLFLDTLIEMMQCITIGTYKDDPEPFMGPVISMQAAHKILQTEANLQASGGFPLVKLKLYEKQGSLLSPGLIDVSQVKNRPDEEIFGPLLQVIRVNNLEEAIQESNHTSYGLTAGLLSDDPKEYEVFYKRVRAGIINWNNPLTGASSAAPFGGIGQSGNHRPSAFYAADYCSYPVASLESETLKMPFVSPIGIKL